MSRRITAAGTSVELHDLGTLEYDARFDGMTAFRDDWDEALEAVAASAPASCLTCGGEHPTVPLPRCLICHPAQVVGQWVPIPPVELARHRRDRFRLLTRMGIRIKRAAVRVPERRRAPAAS